MRGYVELLRHEDARVPWIAAGVARIVPGMAVVAVVLLVRRSGQGYDAAGLAAAVMSLGTAAATPLWGRRIDRRGPVPLVTWLGVVYLAATLALAVAVTRDAPQAVVLVTAGVVGIAFPPVSPVVRVAWRRIYGLGRRDEAFSLDGVTVELGFVMGPIVAAALVDLAAPWAGIVAAGIAMATGTTMLARAAAIRAIPGTAATIRGGALRIAAVRVLMLVFALVGMAFGTIDILAPAVAEANGRPALTGVLLGSFALGSAVGGLVYGSHSWPGTRPRRLLVLVTLLVGTMLATSAVVDTLAGFGLVALVGGLVIAPAIVIIFALADDLAPTSVVTEALAWVNTAVLAGAAAGSAVAGQAVERVGPARAAWIGAGMLVLAAAVVAASQRTLSAEPVRT